MIIDKKLGSWMYSCSAHAAVFHVSVEEAANEGKYYICHQAGANPIKNTFINPITIWGQYYNGKVHSLSHCQHVLITYPVSFFSLSLSPAFTLSLSLTLSKKMHLIMQRPSCRISKVIDVIRLLTSASSHAQNIKEGLTHKWAAYCCVGLVITLLRAWVC